MPLQKQKYLQRAIITVQIILFIEVFVLAIPPVHEAYRNLRWTSFNGIVIYHGIGSLILFLFAAILFASYLKDRSATNLRFFTIAMLFGGVTFLWSAIADSTAVLQRDPVTEQDYIVVQQDIFNHDTLWYPFMALFILFFYLSIESARTDRPPLSRVMIVSAGVILPLVIGIASRLEGENLVSDTNTHVISIITILVTFLFGMIFTLVLGVLTYYDQIKNVRTEELVIPAVVQFTSLLGLAEGLIIISLDFALGALIGERPLDVQFPLILITFLPPLIFLYVRNPSYISTLSTPVYELLVINDKGLTILSHHFALDEDPGAADKAFLKGGIISAITTIFQEITGSKSSIDKVDMADRTVLLEKMVIDGKSWIIGLIVLESNAMIRNSLQAFKKILVSAIEVHQVNRRNIQLPPLDKEIKKVFY